MIQSLTDIGPSRGEELDSEYRTAQKARNRIQVGTDYHHHEVAVSDL